MRARALLDLVKPIGGRNNDDALDEVARSQAIDRPGEEGPTTDVRLEFVASEPL